jgi:hypothetical protein
MGQNDMVVKVTGGVKAENVNVIIRAVEGTGKSTPRGICCDGMCCNGLKPSAMAKNETVVEKMEGKVLVIENVTMIPK